MAVWEPGKRQSKKVCFTCRISNKHGGTCTRCKNPMVSIGECLRAPHANNKKEWKKLKNKLEAFEARKENKVFVYERHQCKRCMAYSFKGEYVRDLCKNCHHDLCVFLDGVTIPYHRRPLCCLVNPTSGMYCNGCSAGLCPMHTRQYEEVCPTYDKVYHKWMRKTKVRKARCAFEK